MEGSTPSPRGRNSSASFQELDVEFLQTQAREWLEAVMEEKLDPGTSLQDLLADGTVLYRVSQIVKEQLSKVKEGQAEHRPAVAILSPDVNRRTSLKYQPYSYVEAFLKVCKDVGLLDLDLFNPSDAVDKKDIRHVCVCLRRLSKKAQTLNIRLPDFDNVKHTLLRSPSHKHTMPTEAVHSLRDSLQHPSSKPASRFSITSEELSKEISSSIAGLQEGDSDPNGVSSESGVRSDENPEEVLQVLDGIVGSSREPSFMEPIDLAKQAEADVEASTSISKDTDLSAVETTTSVSQDTDFLPVETTTSVFEDTDLRLVETTISVSEDPEFRPVETCASDERDLRPVSYIAESEKPQENGLEMSCQGLSPTKLEALEQCMTKGKGKRKDRRPWIPFAAGAIVVVGAIVVMVVARERRQPSPVLYEAQSGHSLAGKSSWRDIVRNNPDIRDPNLIHPN